MSDASAVQIIGIGSTVAPADGTVKPSSIISTFGGFFRNILFNPRFQIGQRGTTFSTPGNGAYTLDRWCVTYDGTIGTFTISQQAFTAGQTAVPNNPLTFLRWSHTSAGSASTFRNIEQRVLDVTEKSGKTLVLTAWLKADTTRTVTPKLTQNFGSGGSSSVDTSSVEGAMSLTTSWQLFTRTFVVPSVSGMTIGSSNFLSIVLQLPINTTMTIDVSDIQLEELGPTSFDQRPIGYEMMLCEIFCQTLQLYVPLVANTVPLPFKTRFWKTPSITGGGTGFATSGLSQYGGSCYQTTAADQTLLAVAEL